MAQASFRHGKPLMLDHTPSADVTSGEVIAVGDGCLIAHSDIPADTLGAVASCFGIYLMAKAGGSAIADRKKVYWDDTNKVATETASGNKFLGLSVGSAASADTEVMVQHIATAS